MFLAPPSKYIVIYDRDQRIILTMSGEKLRILTVSVLVLPDSSLWIRIVWMSCALLWQTFVSSSTCLFSSSACWENASLALCSWERTASFSSSRREISPVQERKVTLKKVLESIRYLKQRNHHEVPFSFWSLALWAFISLMRQEFSSCFVLTSPSWSSREWQSFS